MQNVKYDPKANNLTVSDDLTKQLQVCCCCIICCLSIVALMFRFLLLRWFPPPQDKTYSQYYAVIVQYTAKHHNEKMVKAVRALREPKLSNKLFNFRLAASEVGSRY
jgi:hypothetical protein